jgi:hypothetical protein
MWTDLWEKWRDNANLPFPDIVLGDWNFIEDARDRLSGGNVGFEASASHGSTSPFLLFLFFFSDTINH